MTTNTIQHEPACTNATPCSSGLPRISRIVEIMEQEFGEKLDTNGFMDDLWVALQVIYGPSGAAFFIRERQFLR